MKQSLLISVASAILLLCVVIVHSSTPANNTGGESDAEREAWKKIREQTAEFLAHEREYVMSQRKPIPGLNTSGQAVVAETVSAVNAAPVAAAPESAAPASAAPSDTAATTLLPVTTMVPTNASSVSVGNTTDLPQSTTSAPTAA